MRDGSLAPMGEEPGYKIADVLRVAVSRKRLTISLTASSRTRPRKLRRKSPAL